ncbi:MAG: PqqD family protein [Geobacteraceae bacterium]|nr:PqqD family protein [Geobacteraceae bacterium]
MDITLDRTYVPSEDIVARVIEGELIIVPLVSGIGDMDDELYTLNETGRAIWSRLDGEKSLREIAADLAAEFNAAPGVVEHDVLGLIAELLRRKMLNVL